jgi:hypothetical protein
MTIEKKQIRFESNQYIPGYGYAKGKIENVTTDVYQKLLAAGVELTLLTTFFETKVEPKVETEEPLKRGIPVVFDAEPFSTVTEEQIKVWEEAEIVQIAEEGIVDEVIDTVDEIIEEALEEAKEPTLEEMTTDELKALAKTLGITVKYHDKKNRIIDLIKKKQEAK